MEREAHSSGYLIYNFTNSDARQDSRDRLTVERKEFTDASAKHSNRTSAPESSSFSATNSSMIPGLHSQVMKLRAEDEHLAKDILEAMEVPKERLAIWQLTAQMRDVLANSPRPVIPSPLGAKAQRQSIRLWDAVQ